MLKVSDILLRDVQVEWFEAVAVVREALDRVHAVPGSHLPDLHNIALLPSGQIVLSGASEAGDSLLRAGQLIQALIGRSEPPVQLRLLVAQATAPMGRPYES